MDRAVAPVVAVALLVAVSVLAASAVAAAAVALDPPDESASAALSLSVDASADRLSLVHRAGDPLDVSRLSVTVAVDDQPLAHQPPVPFFAAEGFRSGPTGPFNRDADPTWHAGERATLRVAGTNDPPIEAGDRVSVRVHRENLTVARVRARAK